MRVEVTRTIPGPYQYSKTDVKVSDDVDPAAAAAWMRRAEAILDKTHPFHPQGAGAKVEGAPRPSIKQREYIESLAKRLKRNVTVPDTAHEASDLIEAMKKEVGQ